MAINMRLRKRAVFLEGQKDKITISDKNNNMLDLLTGSAVNRLPVQLHDGKKLIEELPVIDTVHNRIHRGELYRGISYKELSSVGNTYYYEILPPDEEDIYCHFSFDVYSDKKGEAFILEDFNKLNEGTDVKLRNAKRDAGDEPYTEIREDVGYSNDGLAYAIDVIPSLSTYERNTLTERFEWILDKEKKYGLKLVSQEQNIKFYVRFVVYEIEM